MARGNPQFLGVLGFPANLNILIPWYCGLADELFNQAP